MNPHKIIQIALLISVIVPAITHGWYLLRWRCSGRKSSVVGRKS